MSSLLPPSRSSEHADFHSAFQHAPREGRKSEVSPLGTFPIRIWVSIYDISQGIDKGVCTLFDIYKEGVVRKVNEC